MDTRERILLCLWGLFTLGFISGWAQVTEPSSNTSDIELPNVKKLRDKLFKDGKYDSAVRPITHHSNTTVVQIGIAPKYIIDLNEDRSLFVLDAWLVLFWNDFRLTWNPEDFEGLNRLFLPDHMLWQPDIHVYNSYSWNVDPKMNTRLMLLPTGDIWLVPPAVTTTYCPMDNAAGSYPYETIECEIQMGSWSHDGWQIDLQTMDESIYMDEFMNNNPRWNLLVDRVNITRDVRHYNCCEEPYITVIATFPLERKYPAELDVIWSPCILVMALTLAMFWIRPDSGKKLILGPTLILVLTMLIVYVAKVTRSPASPPKAASFLTSTMYGVASAVLLEVVVISISSISGPTRPPEVLINLLSGPIGRNVAIYARWLDGTAIDKIQLKEESEQVVIHPSAKDEWMLVGAAIDRILFVVYICVFVAIHRL